MSTHTSAQRRKIACERLIWLVQPLGIMVLISWIIHPATSAPAKLEHHALVAFLAAALLTIFSLRHIIKDTLNLEKNAQSMAKNTFQEGFLLGEIKETYTKKQNISHQAAADYFQSLNTPSQQRHPSDDTNDASSGVGTETPNSTQTHGASAPMGTPQDTAPANTTPPPIEKV